MLCQESNEDSMSTKRLHALRICFQLCHDQQLCRIEFYITIFVECTELTLLVVEGLELQSFSYHPAFFSRCWTCLLSLPAVLLSV